MSPKTFSTLELLQGLPNTMGWMRKEFIRAILEQTLALDPSVELEVQGMCFVPFILCRIF